MFIRDHRLQKRVLLLVLASLVGSTVACSRNGATSRKENHSGAIALEPRSRKSEPNGELRLLEGNVISILDGDTIEIVDDQRVTYRIRLQGIDAPEYGQPFADESRENLGRLIAGKPVNVEWEKHDRYRRIVGKVVEDRTDVCLEQIRAGLAWHFKRFMAEQSQADRDSYALAETQARARKVGLWVDAFQTPPWEFRRH